MAHEVPMLLVDSCLACSSRQELLDFLVAGHIGRALAAHKIRGDQRSMIGKNQVMIADMSVMPITLIGHISKRKPHENNLNLSRGV